MNCGEVEKMSGMWSIYSPFDDVWEFSFAGIGKERSGEIDLEAIIVIIISGSLHVMLDGIGGIVRSHEMFIIPPGSIYQSKALKDTHAILCRFPAETIPETRLLKNDILSGKEDFCDGLKTLKLTQILSDYLHLMESYLKEGIPVKELYKIKRQELFYLIYSSYTSEELAPFLYSVTKEGMPFRVFVLKTWKKAHNVEELAAMANLSTSGFKKKFRKYFNESPYKWMLQNKAKCVREEIMENKLPLKAIADKYHFSSYAHFGTFCREQYGASPKDLQALIQSYLPKTNENKK